MKAKSLLMAVALLVAGLITAVAQSNPASASATDVEMQLAWPDGTVYADSMNWANSGNFAGQFYEDFNWDESQGGTGVYGEEPGGNIYLYDWTGGIWPEFGNGCLVDIPGGFTNAVYSNPEDWWWPYVYFGSVNFTSSSGDVYINYNDQSQLMLITGGEPGSTGYELYAISAYAWTAAYTDQALPPNPIINSVSPQQIQIGNLGRLNASNTLWVTLPVHQEVPVTLTINGDPFGNGLINAQPYQLVSQCTATTPSNRARTTIGVGEQVNLYFSTTAPTNTVWSTSAGSLSVTNGSTTILTAPDRKVTATVTAIIPGAPSVSLAFNVIEPSSVYYVTNSFIHTYDEADIGFYAWLYLQPDSVNFYAVQCQEEQAYVVANGVYSEFNGSGHQPYRVISFGGTVVPGLGTGNVGGAYDECYSGMQDPGLFLPYTNGSETLAIPWDFQVGNGVWKTNFSTINWFCSESNGGDHGDGLLNASKSNAHCTMNVDDPSVGAP